MNLIKATSEFGIVIRLSSLAEKKIAIAEILATIGSEMEFDRDHQLISFGPSFGQDALDEFTNRLQKLGLEYWDDFFEFTLDVPDWCILNIEKKENSQ